MSSVGTELRGLVERVTPRLADLGEEASARRPGPNKWSPREVLGHLVDSAANNHQRFVRAQFQDHLVFAGYAQDEWVRVHRYHETPWSELVPLWRAYNLHVARVMEAVPSEVATRAHARHNFHEIGWAPFAKETPGTLEHLMRDYVGHLLHHLRQIPGIEVGA